jgi:hypothetical protein
MMVNKEHLTEEGIKEIIKLKLNLNTGYVSEEILKLYPNILKTELPLYYYIRNYDFNYD